MLQLPPLEMLLFLAIVLVSIGSGVIGCIQITKDNARCKMLLIALTMVQIILAAVVLALRGTAAGHFPMTDIFE